MLEFVSPGWLLSAPLLAATIWWIHRHGTRGRRRAVAALFPWLGVDRPAAGTTRRRLADPAWLRRAIAVALLAGMLAAPQWHSDSEGTAVVWFDNGRSMAAMETDGPRWRAALHALRQALQRRGVTTVLPRPLYSSSVLAEPAGPVTLIQLDHILAAWFEAPAIQGPLPPLPLDGHGHWLVSDLTDPRLEGWIRDADVHDVVAAGSASENAALTSLSLRPTLHDPGLLAGSVVIANTGRLQADGSVVVRVDGAQVFQQHWSLTAGESQSFAFATRVPGGGTVEAVLERAAGADALPIDNRLSLAVPANAWRARALIDPACSRALSVLLEATGLTTLVDRPPIDLDVRCSAVSSGIARPTLHVLDSGDPAATDRVDVQVAPDPVSGMPQATVHANLTATMAADADAQRLLRIASALGELLQTDVRDRIHRTENRVGDSQLRATFEARPAAETGPASDATHTAALWRWVVIPAVALLLYDLWRCHGGKRDAAVAPSPRVPGYRT